MDISQPFTQEKIASSFARHFIATCDRLLVTLASGGKKIPAGNDKLILQFLRAANKSAGIKGQEQAYTRNVVLLAENIAAGLLTFYTKEELIDCTLLDFSVFLADNPQENEFTSHIDYFREVSAYNLADIHAMAEDVKYQRYEAALKHKRRKAGKQP